MNYVITGGNFTSPLLQELEGHFGIRCLTEAELEASDRVFQGDDKLFVPSQSALDTVMARMACPERLRLMEQLSDKYRCRLAMAPLFPDFEFTRLELSEIRADLFSPGRKYVIKPVKGFFSVGVRVPDAPGDSEVVKAGIRQELEANRGFFSSGTFSGEEMIVEQFIEGDEYAVDMFYSEEGEPAIVSLAYHPPSENTSYNNVLYYTNDRISREIYPRAMDFSPDWAQFRPYAPFPSMPNSK